MRILFVVFTFVDVLAEMHVDFLVLALVERVYTFEFILFHIEERRNI